MEEDRFEGSYLGTKEAIYYDITTFSSPYLPIYHSYLARPVPKQAKESIKDRRGGAAAGVETAVWSLIASRNMGLSVTWLSRICGLTKCSLLRKGERRRNKSFPCNEPSYKRNDGFYGAMDLARHKRSLHPHAFMPGPRYKCSEGNCVEKLKIWPRADNSRAHLKTIHKLQIAHDEID